MEAMPFGGRSVGPLQGQIEDLVFFQHGLSGGGDPDLPEVVESGDLAVFVPRESPGITCIDSKRHDSYGYRLGKSALEAVGQCRQRCWSFGRFSDFG